MQSNLKVKKGVLFNIHFKQFLYGNLVGRQMSWEPEIVKTEPSIKILYTYFGMVLSVKSISKKRVRGGGSRGAKAKCT